MITVRLGLYVKDIGKSAQSCKSPASMKPTTPEIAAVYSFSSVRERAKNSREIGLQVRPAAGLATGIAAGEAEP